MSEHMSEQLKRNEVSDMESLLKTKIRKAMDSRRFERAYALISLCADLLYETNQKYTDIEIENWVTKLAENITIPKSYEKKSSKVLFYDGFGLDLRGWAISYVKALIAEGYEVIYLTPESAKDRIPHILNELSKGGKAVFFSDRNYLSAVSGINQVFAEEMPKAAFFYTRPNDIPAAAVFAAYRGHVTRFQVDLTDHAYWVGTKAVDRALECREMGASNAINGRALPKDVIRKIDCSPYINQDDFTRDLPFDIHQERYVFSGGQLYKTLGDKENLFYRAIGEMLDRYPDMHFLYAGEGDRTQMDILIDKYQGRVHLVGERKDFFTIIQHSVFYLNTYPMFGGLMMRYAALAGRLPLTLRHNNDSDGLLINQEALGIEFDTYDAWLKEIFQVIDEPEYRAQKEKRIAESVITSGDFSRNLKLLIEEDRTEYSFASISKINTEKFQGEFLKRFSMRAFMDKAIPTKKNAVIFWDYPWVFARKFLRIKSARFAKSNGKTQGRS